MGMTMRLVGLGRRITVEEGAEGGVGILERGRGGVAMTVWKVVGEGAGTGVG